ncbi:MAG: 1-acyl-sn-glycerol-3-phosphate acyltransferase [Bryobacteraceae bacterium]|nr:1-acyl-sn-glycerol-3-phosphate acyltransferase [Bryobacteraceae bacterium]MDW8377465.1 lysophospholipid acyltransferase family protein [Bryobacterales bacterium]
MQLALYRSLLITIPACFAWTAILCTLSFLIMPFAKPETHTRLWRYWARSMLWLCGARVKVFGLENLVPGQHYIFASNHLSLIDSPVLVAYLPRTLRFLAKRELFSIPFMGWYMKAQGHIAIDRGDPRATLRSLSEAAALIQSERKSVLVFPEGTRSMDGRLQEFKEGAALLAIRAQTPLVPAAVVGTQRVLPAKSKVIRGGEVELRIGAPIDVRRYELKQRAQLTARLRNEVAALIDSSPLKP